MSKLRITLLLLLVFYKAQAQFGLTSQYQFNYLSINPAFAGENGLFSVKGVLGNQFYGTLVPNQVSQVAAIDGELYNNSGLAFQGFRNNLGNLISTGFGFSYSKGMELGDVLVKYGVDLGTTVQPNLLTIQGSQRLSPFAGLGGLVDYKGIYLGISKPMLVSSKRITEAKPIYFNLGFYHDIDNLFSFNINTLFSYDAVSKKQNTDLNLKVWLNKRLGVSAALRNDNIYNAFEKSKWVIPAIEYKFTEGFQVGLGYNSNPLKSSVSSQTEIKTNGVFLLTFRYLSTSSDNDSRFFNKL